MLQVAFSCTDQLFSWLALQTSTLWEERLLAKSKTHQAMIFIDLILENNITCPLLAFYFHY